MKNDTEKTEELEKIISEAKAEIENIEGGQIEAHNKPYEGGYYCIGVDSCDSTDRFAYVHITKVFGSKVTLEFYDEGRLLVQELTGLVFPTETITKEKFEGAKDSIFVTLSE